MNSPRQALLFSGLLGFTAVALAAAGSHLVAGPEPGLASRSWQAANGMHLFHATALLALSAAMQSGSSRLLRFAGWAWLAGVVLFSGSLYVQVLRNMESTWGIAPLGGSLLMAGWIAVAAAAARRTA